MIRFSARLVDDQQVVGIGLSAEDLERLVHGELVMCDLDPVRTGFWREGEDGRVFLQPRASHVLLMLGDQPADVGRVLQVEMPDLDKIKNSKSG